MRIIAGSRRRLKLKTLKGDEVRPTSDRIKETLFNMLQNEVPGCYFLDLFAGSGQIGLEAASRGAKYTVLVEHGKQAAACIRENIEHTKLEKECRLLQMDALSALRSLEGKYRFGVIFMDPPYGQGLEKEMLSYLRKSSLADGNTLIVVEADLETDFSYLSQEGYALLKEKKYKTNQHVFLTLAATGDGEAPDGLDGA